jgi:hypothetical protein
MLDEIFKYTSIRDVKKQIKELAKKKNNDDLSPIEMALNMIYSDKQFRIVQFLIIEGDTHFEPDLEDKALKHLINIFKFNENSKQLDKD